MTANAPVSRTVPAPTTRSTEDYLKAIYGLSGADASVSTNAIAEHLGLTAASVSGMIKRLSEQALLEHVPYRGVRLTQEGERIALRMIRRHRIIEAYLVGFLGYTWDAVHAEAESLEHAVSDSLIERMAHSLGNPTADPHGDPIPDAEGRISAEAHVALVDLPIGAAAVVRRVCTTDEARLRYLAAAGLVPGAALTVVDRQPFNGPTTVRVGAHDRAVGAELGAILLCSPVES
jgi:DtxR family transcriptional regulator, Mn-dependent transcriptional regulator